MSCSFDEGIYETRPGRAPKTQATSRGRVAKGRRRVSGQLRGKRWRRGKYDDDGAAGDGRESVDDGRRSIERKSRTTASGITNVLHCVVGGCWTILRRGSRPPITEGLRAVLAGGSAWGEGVILVRVAQMSEIGRRVVGFEGGGAVSVWPGRDSDDRRQLFIILLQQSLAQLQQAFLFFFLLGRVTMTAMYAPYGRQGGRRRGLYHCRLQLS